MSERRGWRRWARDPQMLGWRKTLLQLHLWIGLVMGLYVVMISVSGSAVVFRREWSRWFMPDDWRIEDGVPVAIRLMEWLVDLHDNLLAGSTGRTINGIGAMLVMAVVLSGAVLWWPGRGRWRRSLVVPRPTRTRRFAWHLHSALGFWGFVLLFGWAVTGVYFAFPEPFEGLMNALDRDPTTFERPGEAALLALIRWHFGRFGGLGVRTLWVVLGLLPAALFVTGFIVWWRRSARPVPVNETERQPPAVSGRPLE
jgi:uncharacterized iron-regulated membrane protein